MSQCSLGLSVELSPLAGVGQLTICRGPQAGTVRSRGSGLHAGGLQLLGQAVGDLACHSAYSEPLTNRASATCLLHVCLLFFISLHLSFWVRSLTFSTGGILFLTSPSCWTWKFRVPRRLILCNFESRESSAWLTYILDRHPRTTTITEHEQGPQGSASKNDWYVFQRYCKTCRHSKWSIGFTGLFGLNGRFIRIQT